MKKRVLSAFLALCMALALVPAAGAYEEPYDVYQADGFYITVTPFKLNSTKYTIGKASTFDAGDHSFHDGMLVVWADLNSDESYVNREYVWEINLADKNGNIVLPDGSLLSYGSGLYHAQATYTPSEGLVMFWDKETGLYGYKDYSGRVVIPAQFENGDHLRPFREGLAYISAGISVGSFIDQTGRTVIDKIFCHGDRFSDGLIWTSRDNGNGTWTAGYFDKTGTMVLPLITCTSGGSYRGDYWKMYADGKTDGYLMPMNGTLSHFSGGYAVVQDLRSGSEGAYAYAIIDKSGNVVGTFRDAKVGSGVHEGLIGVEFLDARGNGTGYGYIDIHGNVVFRSDKNDKDGVPYGCSPFNCGVSSGGSVLYDTKGNVVIPKGHFQTFNGNGEFAFDDNLSLAWAYADGKPYVLEIHQGTYTGSGRVYNHSQGVEVTAPTVPARYSTNVQSIGTTTVEGWGGTQTVDLYPAGTVFTLSEGCMFSDIHQLNGDHISNGRQPTFTLPADGVYRIFIVTGSGASEYIYVSAGDTSQTTAPTDTTTAPALSIPALDALPRTETYTPGQFSDVSETAWYASSVRTAYELGLVKGSGAGYAPADPISIAETLVLACRLHNAYFGSPATFEQGSPWYQVYVDYAIANGIISPAGFPNYAAPANRQTFASIMANALPEEALPAINSISGIPDSASVSPSILPAVLKLYNAGILTGSDAKGTFNPGSSIQRSEVAAIVTRMAVPAERVRFVL